MTSAISAPIPVAAMARVEGIALWRQIANALEADVAAGTLAAGARLPGELALAARFGVNRHTVRRAVEELARAGLIRVEQGRGSFVADDVLDYAIGPRTRFSEWIRRHNREPSGQVLALEEIPADATVAAGLGVASGAPVIRFRRLGLADGRPVSLGAHHFCPVRLPDIAAALAAEPTITAALHRAGVADYRRQSTRVGARLPNAAEARLLSTGRSRPLLVCENTNVDPAGRVVEFCLALYPTPRVQLIFEP